MKHNCLILSLCLFLLSCERPASGPAVFSLHLFQEPLHLDPARSRGSSAAYFFYNTMRGLYRIDQNNQLQEEAGSCRWKSPTRLTCQIKDDYWSSGEPVLAQDYLRSFRHLVNPQQGSPRAQLLDLIQGAPEILSGQKPPSTLAMKVTAPKTFEIDFIKPDLEFLYKLASTALYPTHPKHRSDKKSYRNFLGNGPYQIASWEFGHQMLLKPNPHYKRGNPERPDVRFYFIDDEMTAFRLYEQKKMAFLRRLPSKLISTLQKRPDFLQQPMLRFDYVGFGPSLRNEENLRKALLHSVDYQALKKLLGALERPGCPSLPKQWFIKQGCFDFDLNKARAYLEKVAPSAKNKVYEMQVSQLGGEDIKKQAEFYQNQWKLHLGIQINVSQVEQKVFLSGLRTSPPDIFRKGVGLDRPTCLNALQTFTDDSKQNFIGLQDNEYRETLKTLQSLKPRTQSYKKACQKGMDFLLNKGLIMPLGEMHFSVLASPNYTGWTLNGLNQLDLSQVAPTKQQ